MQGLQGSGLPKVTKYTINLYRNQDPESGLNPVSPKHQTGLCVLPGFQQSKLVGVD